VVQLFGLKIIEMGLIRPQVVLLLSVDIDGDIEFEEYHYVHRLSVDITPRMRSSAAYYFPNRAGKGH
jgi:hypothetical protein